MKIEIIGNGKGKQNSTSSHYQKKSVFEIKKQEIMDTKIEIAKARVYVGTYHKYNSGSIYGEWLDIFDYDNREEFFSACRELHNDEQDPEFMFQDYENIPKSLISEGWMSQNFYEVMEALNDMDFDKLKPFLIWLDNFGYDLSKDDVEDINDLITSFEQDYRGEYSSEVDFARELAEQQGDQLSGFLARYFDYEAYARDLFIDGFWSSEGYVFADR